MCSIDRWFKSGSKDQQWAKLRRDTDMRFSGSLSMGWDGIAAHSRMQGMDDGFNNAASANYPIVQ